MKKWGHGQCHKVVALLLILVKEMSKRECPMISKGNHPGIPLLSASKFPVSTLIS